MPSTVHAALLVHVHAAEPAAPVHASCVAHVCVPMTLRHPFSSALHVASVVPFSHTDPEVVHVALTLHVHAPEPALPVQLSSDGHATAAP